MERMKLNLFSWNFRKCLELTDSKLSNRKLWLYWFVILSTVFLIHLLTLTISPPLWMDEAQIIEHGRLMPFEPHSAWSVNWWSTADRPILLWSYLGPALQEMAFRITTPLPYGPRLASLFGAMVAATVLVGWLLSMKTYRPVSLILGLVFLLDPIFVQSYRGARVDCWALAFCFGACWAVRYAMSQMQGGRRFKSALAMGGILAAVAFFVWPSSVLTYPLVLAELIVLLREDYSMHRSGAGVLRSVAAFVVSGLAATFMLLIPVWHLLDTVFDDILPILSASQPPYSLSPQLKNLLDSFKYSQLLLVAALITFSRGQGRLIAWAALLTLVYILCTRLYLARLIYLLPYAIALVGGAYQIPLTLNTKVWRSITNVGVSVLVIVSISLSLIVRPVLALSQKGERDPNILFSIGRESIGDGPYRVYLGAWEFYL